jgi:hypothetical protein
LGSVREGVVMSGRRRKFTTESKIAAAKGTDLEPPRGAERAEVLRLRRQVAE